MNRQGFIVIAFLLLSVVTARTQDSQDYKVTRTGVWDCYIAFGPSGGAAQGCQDINGRKYPHVPFDPPFADVPELAVSLTSFSGTQFTQVIVNQPKPDKIDKAGFYPDVSASQLNTDSGGVGKISGTWTAVGHMAEHSTITPKYVVLSVIYAPPGGNKGLTPTSVVYQSGITVSTKLSVSKSFKSLLKKGETARHD